MFFVVQRGTILVPSAKGPHLNVILTAPRGKGGEVLIAPFSSVKLDHRNDRSCLVGKGDHPFLVKDSYVAYSFAEILKAEAIEDAVNRRVIEPHEMCSQELHALICGGLLKSPYAAPRYKKFYEESLVRANSAPGHEEARDES